MGVSAIGHLHVYDPCLAVRKRGSSVYDFAFTSAFDSICVAVTLADGKHSEPVFGAWYSGAVRSRQEERDPADRSHERSQKGRDGSAGRNYSRESRPPSPDPDDHACVVAGMMP